MTEEEIIDALRIDPFDDGLVEALRALRRRGSPGRSRDRRWEVGLRNILAGTSGDELEENRRDVVRAWARLLANTPGSDPVTASVEVLDIYGEGTEETP